MTEAPGLPVRVGDFIAAKYRVERVLGAGAMGVVVAARHLELQELRAIKLMLPSALSDAEAIERFLREARAPARLKSDHVAKVYDVARLETGSPYIVIELLEGVDLKTMLDQEPMLAPQRAARLVAQACDAVGEAHTLGIVHRDIKPANLFLTTAPRGGERLKVLDFGIAKMADPAGGGVDMTRTTAVLGTPLYMSPEQMRGARNADARSDVWALGVILYRMLTGRVPFSGSTITEVCSAVISDTPEPPRAVRPDLPAGLEAVILRCLEKNPAARFANAGELGAALAVHAEGTGEVAIPRAVDGESTVVLGLPAAGGPAAGGPARSGPAAGGPGAFGMPPGASPGPSGASTVTSIAWVQSGASSSGAGTGMPDRASISTGGAMGAVSVPRPPSRAPLVAVAALVGVIAAGSGGWLALRGKDGSRSESLDPTRASVTATASIESKVAPTAPVLTEAASPATTPEPPVAPTVTTARQALTSALPPAKPTVGPTPAPTPKPVAT